jgi:hypothetical protein
MNRSSYQPRIPHIMLDVLRPLHFERGHTIAELASAIGIRERSLRSAFIKRGFYKDGWTDAEVRRLHQRYLAGEFPSTLARMRRRSSAALLARFRKLGLSILEKKKYTIPSRRLPAGLVLAMHADYMAGMTFAAVERKHGRPEKSIRPIFVHRGLHVRDDGGYSKVRTPSGSFAPLIPKTDEEITVLVEAATKVAVPAELKQEWRKWTLARRGEFIARVRAHLQDPKDRPRLPFSSNVAAFDYASPEAWEIVKIANAGLGSRDWRTKLDIRSQGVIFEGELWFWNTHSGGYFRMGAWTAENGRPSLHRTLWERLHGSVPEGHVVRHADGNPNNFQPANLILAHRNDVARENQAAALNRKSRERTRLLLERSTKPKPSHDLVASLTQG